MVTISEIESRLRVHFVDAGITVLDDSAKHAGHTSAPAGGGSHFTVKINSAQFAGHARIARHRMVYAVLQPLFDQGLHALAIEAEVV